MSTGSPSTSSARTRSPTPFLPAQPDHFYGNENVQLPPSPHSAGRDWLDPADYPTAQQGIPVFRPTMQEFQDFEGYMTRVGVETCGHARELRTGSNLIEEQLETS